MKTNDLRPRLVLKSGKEKSIYRMHPWIFSGAIQKIIGKPVEGDLVDLVDCHGNYLATGHFQSDSIIVKILSFGNPFIDKSFWKERIQKALDYRKSLHLLDNPETNLFRLIHSEGDGMSGLIADFYNGVLVLQAHSEGMHRLFPEFIPLFKEVLGERLVAIYDKSSATLPHPNATDAFCYGTADEAWEVMESGNRFLIRFPEAQKTGFFIDQRDNRFLLSRFCKGKKVLNTFGYTGGFSVAALRGEAAFVETVDVSKKAIQWCEENVLLNFSKAPHKGVAADALDYLCQTDNAFDLIVLDPPAFAKNHRSLQQGLKAYRHINQKALEKINNGGFLFTFSCSQAVSKEDFKTMLFTASANAGRNVRIVSPLSQAADHPVSIYHPEGEYLKGFLVYVE